MDAGAFDSDDPAGAGGGGGAGYAAAGVTEVLGARQAREPATAQITLSYADRPP